MEATEHAKLISNCKSRVAGALAVYIAAERRLETMRMLPQRYSSQDLIEQHGNVKSARQQYEALRNSLGAKPSR